MFTKIHGLTAAVALTLAAAAGAQTATAPSATPRSAHFENMLKSMDTNGDGRISLDEYLGEAARRFQTIDSQNKGRVDAADIASSPQAIARIDRKAEHLVKRLDTVGAGFVTQDEFVAAAQKRFARLDKNGDGKLTADELTFARGDHRGSGAGDTGGKSGAFAARRFEKLDANHDGVVTLDEYVAAAKTLYGQLDTAASGKLTAADIEAAPKTRERALRVANHMVAHMDMDRDGSVTKEEFLAAARTRFAKTDRNGDGYIEADEVRARHWAQGRHYQG